jgi:hypothetical protein
MYITIKVEQKQELQWYIDQLLQEGWCEIKQFYLGNPHISRKIQFYILQK